MVDKIPFILPSVPHPRHWLPFLKQSYDAHTFSNGGPCVQQLEQELQEKYAPTREAILTSSGTSGLIAVLLSLRRTGTVIVPAYTFSATIHAVQAAGCMPVLCDVSVNNCPSLVSRETWELDPNLLAKKILTHNPVAVVHVRAYGFCQDLTPIKDVCHGFDVPLIVDSAAALGGRLPNGEYAGNTGIAEVFSLHATKPFNVGEGGLILANPLNAFSIRRAINFGMLSDKSVIQRGFNGKMSEVSAAIGLAMLQQIDDQLAERRRIVEGYMQAGLGKRLPEEIGSPPWQTFPYLTDQASKLYFDFQDAEIEVQRGYKLLKFFYGEKERFPVAEYLTESMICLPVFVGMTEEEQHRVITVLK